MAKLIKKSNSKDVLYNFSWQLLRVNLSFKSLEDAKSSLNKLKKYVDEKDVNKVWRVLNLLSATRMGLSGQQKRDLSEEQKEEFKKIDEQVKEFREHLSDVYKNLPKDFKLETEEKKKKDISNAKTEDIEKILKSLKDRYEKGGPSGIKQSPHRTSLKEYIKFLEDELKSRN